MNGNNAMLDGNILIYLSKNELPLAFLDQFDSLFISVISYIDGISNNYNCVRVFNAPIADVFEHRRQRRSASKPRGIS